jgi:hypothetical protein
VVLTGDEMSPSGDEVVAGRSLDEWSERLFPDVSMRVTDAYDEDSPYSRAVQVPCHDALSLLQGSIYLLGCWLSRVQSRHLQAAAIPRSC